MSSKEDIYPTFRAHSKQYIGKKKIVSFDMTLGMETTQEKEKIQGKDWKHRDSAGDGL